MILSGFDGFAKGAALAALTAFGLAMATPAWAREPTESFAELVDKLMPTVVNITTTQNVPQQGPRLRDMPQLPPGSPFEELFKEFFHAFAMNAGICLHLELLYGENSHHIAEASFKSLARALRAAAVVDGRLKGQVASTKGSL